MYEKLKEYYGTMPGGRKFEDLTYDELRSLENTTAFAFWNLSRAWGDLKQAIREHSTRKKPG